MSLNKINQKQFLRQQYLRYCIGYYIAARFSVFSGLWIMGNLFHHAVEMLLKGFLCIDLEEKAMKNFSKSGHSLLDAWKLFKGVIGDKNADQFDDIITSLDEFEDIRYPDRVIKQGAIIVIDPLSIDGKKFQSSPNANHYNILNGRREKIYRFNLSSIYSLIEFIFIKTAIDPNSFINLYGNDEMKYLKKYNKSKIWNKRMFREKFK